MRPMLICGRLVVLRQSTYRLAGFGLLREPVVVVVHHHHPAVASLAKKCRHGRKEWDECGCQWVIRRKVAGRDTYTPVGYRKADAERALRKASSAGEETMTDAVAAWLDSKARAPGARAGSLAAFRGRSKHITAYFGSAPVRRIRPEHMTQFADDLMAAGKSPGTVRAIYAALTGTLRHAARRGVIPSVPKPVDGPGIPNSPKRDATLTLSQVGQILKRMEGTTWGIVAELVVLTGLRWGEAVAIERGDIDGKVLRVQRTRNRDGGVNPPKTKSGTRLVPLSPRALKILGTLDLPVGHHYSTANKALRKGMGNLHHPGMGWHTLRNAHASLLEAAGVTLRDQAARLGHGTNYAQSLAYGLAVEAGSADEIDVAVRKHASPGSSGAGARRRRPAGRRSKRAR